MYFKQSSNEKVQLLCAAGMSVPGERTRNVRCIMCGRVKRTGEGCVDDVQGWCRWQGRMAIVMQRLERLGRERYNKEARQTARKLEKGESSRRIRKE